MINLHIFYNADGVELVNHVNHLVCNFVSYIHPLCISDCWMIVANPSMGWYLDRVLHCRLHLGMYVEYGFSIWSKWS